MAYLSVKEIAEKWNLSERSVRNYCQEGKIPGAFIVGKTWSIPENANKPARKERERTNAPSILEVIKLEKDSHIKGRIYHKIQVDLTYNSNHMEGSRLTHDQTRYIYETNTIGIDSKENSGINIDDIIETVNHFRCIDYMIDHAHRNITEKMMKDLHLILKTGTSDSRKSWFAVGDYKRLGNEVGGLDTTAPENVAKEIKRLLKDYNSIESPAFDDLLDFHFRFERIHPFQDGNGRVGRLLLFKECLKCNIIPFIIDDNMKMFYYRGLSEWKNERGFLRDTCLSAQDKFKAYLDYFGIQYKEN